MAKKQQISGIGIMKIALGKPLSCPKRRLYKDLAFAMAECNRARCAMVQAFLRYHWENPGWTPPEVISKRTGKPVLRNGKPKVANFPFPDKVKTKTGDKTGGTYLYHCARDQAPMLNSSIISDLSNEIDARLKTQMPYNHTGDASYMWQGILNCECSPPNAYSSSIPLPASTSTLEFRDSQYILKAAMFSRQWKRKIKGVVLRLDGGKLSAGNRRMLQRICEGEIDFKGSRLVYDEDKDEWFVHLCFEQERNLAKLDPEKEATLEMMWPGCFHALRVSFGDDFRQWCGWAPILKATQGRQERKRWNIRDNRNQRGHGRNVLYAKTKQTTRKVKFAVKHFIRQAVSDAVKFCIQTGCGVLKYLEPSLRVRAADLSWFAKNGVNFPWADFEKQLKRKCYFVGLKLVDAEGNEIVDGPHKRVGMADYRVRLEGQRTSWESAKKNRQPSTNGVHVNGNGAVHANGAVAVPAAR